jgi:WD40 repeat protein
MSPKSFLKSHALAAALLSAFAAALCPVVTAQTGEPSREPILRIETGMHTAVIKRLDVDRAGKFLVTASYDKTARVWELQTGRLLRVLRVPIGDGNEGRLDAAAISPDGNIIAAGGWTGIGGDKDCIYLFERESGRLVRRLTGLPNVVLHLAFSPDGALLAATLGGTDGVRVWRTSKLALKEADKEAGRDPQLALVMRLLPPVVEIASPADGSDTSSNDVVVRYQVRAPSGEPVTEVKLLVDGRPVSTERGLTLPAAGQSMREARVSAPEGESQVSIIASNRFTSSVPATVRVHVRKSATSSSGNTSAVAEFDAKPKLYVLAVGVSSYTDTNLKLSFAAKDAGDFAATMERQKGGLYRDAVVRLLTDERATKEEVLDGLDWIRKETTSKDVAMVLFAGHGINDQNGRYFYLPYNTDLEKLLRTGVSFEDIRNTVSALAGKTLFFIDTCHSGNVLGTRRALNFDIVGVVNELSSAENGAVVFAASTGNQYSLENAAWNNGAFTLAVVEGVGGRADYSGKGRITINMLDLYISERVKELTKGQQTPTTAKPNTVPDFPVALKK